MMALQVPWADQLPARHGMMQLMRLIVNGALDLAPLRRHYSNGLVDLLATLLCSRPQSRPSFRLLLQSPLIKSTLHRLGTPPATPPATPPLSPTATPPLSPTATPPLSPTAAPAPAEETSETATGEAEKAPMGQPRANSNQMQLEAKAAGPYGGTGPYGPYGGVGPYGPAPLAAAVEERFAAAKPARPAAVVLRVPAAAAAAKHLNVYEALTRPDAAADNPFNARFGRERHARAHGADAHAAAMALQRSFHRRQQVQQAQRQRAMAARPAGVPSRPVARPAWAMAR